ncbi:uncharacterized protein LOC127864529 isoform X2 [Dreissena polymorpha]|uniref:uncharacterized protein LOC127864529 isoform X2 n=1 Tax=Dreissena polymorpha TaxID=45954 RepID=UPI002265669E|nr:uncharacterized protein LOC127864529 isoform X2 [Dreissena polymorpha]
MCSVDYAPHYRPFQRSRSEALPPQAADIVQSGQNGRERDVDGKTHLENPTLNAFRTGNGNDAESDANESRYSSGKLNEELLRAKYKGLIEPSSPLQDSDDERESNSPVDYDANRRSDHFQKQHLPSNINLYSPYGLDRSRLPYPLDPSSVFGKDRHSLGDTGGPGLQAQFEEEFLRRRFSLQEPRADLQRDSKLSPGSTGSPSHPASPSSSLQGSSPFTSPCHQRSMHNISFDEQDSNNFLPRIKEGLYFCHLCSFSGSTQEEFDGHMSVHFEHICPHCDYKSRTEGRLKRHIKDFHTDDSDGGYGARTMPGRPKVFRCKQCEFSSTDKIEFWTHSRSHIKEDKILQCPRCPFVTEYKHHLEYHLRNHFGSKPFKCPKCNYACVNKSMLNSHMKSHTNVYQYRCADCTYATKYCHSLKLHLRKYNHKPAAVLNSDGSLPQGVDATASGLSLLAKRGPPRGPRGPRKDKMDQSPPTGYLPLPPSPLGHMPGMSGMPGMMNPFWPMMQMQGRLPLPLAFPPRFNPHLSGLPPMGIKLEDGGLKSTPTSNAGPMPSGMFKCNFCSFVASSQEFLTSHIRTLHATDNKDLFSMFGFSSEMLLGENKKRLFTPDEDEASPSKVQKLDRRFLPNVRVKKEEDNGFHVSKSDKARNGKEAIDLSLYSFMNGKYPGISSMKDESVDILKQMTLKFGSGPVDMQRKYPTSTAPVLSSSPVVSSPMVSSAVHSMDSPLDLTKPRSPDSIPSMQQYPAALQRFKKEEKKLYAVEEEEHSSGENSTYSSHSNPGVASPQQRKRSRKGKAFKLDTFCMKLHEKHGNQYISDDNSDVELEGMYTPELINEPTYVKIEPKEKFGEKVEIDCKENVGEMRIGGKAKEQDGEKSDKNEKSNGDQQELSANEEKLTEIRDKNENNLVDTQEELEDKYVKDMHIKKDGDEVKPLASQGLITQNRRKAVPAAIQRGADIAWKMLNDPEITDPSQIIGNGRNSPKIEMTALDKKLLFEAPECTKTLQGSQPGEFECPHCRIAFGDLVMYTMHMGYHGFRDPYKCNMCGDTCKDRVEFFLHIARAAHN